MKPNDEYSGEIVIIRHVVRETEGMETIADFKR